MMWDEWNEECGVFGVYGHPEAARLTYYGLHALQHRGQESAGICASDGTHFTSHRGMGLVTEVFDAAHLAKLRGHMAIGHVRYTTAGESRLENAQPLVFTTGAGSLALAHNGNLVNYRRIKRRLERQGSLFQTSSDTEVIAHLIARSGCADIVDGLRHALARIQGAYALLVMTERRLIVALDPNGIRPLSLGRLGKGYVVASETCAFDAVGATYVRDVEPGELLVIDEGGLSRERFSACPRRTICTFEYIYFARPDSDVGGINVHLARKRLGRRLAEEAPADADVVTGVPDSSISAAIGYAEATGIPYELGLIKNRYVGRTFIQPTPAMRRRGVHIKHNPIVETLRGKRVILVDDSIVRGTTSRRMIRLLKEAGAKEVHMVVASPPFSHPCLYGIDVPSSDQLIAAGRSVNEVCRLIGADSLHYLDFESLYQAVGVDGRRLCAACFGAPYPTPVDGGASQGGDVLAKGRM